MQCCLNHQMLIKAPCLCRMLLHYHRVVHLKGVNPFVISSKCLIFRAFRSTEIFCPSIRTSSLFSFSFLLSNCSKVTPFTPQSEALISFRNLHRHNPVDFLNVPGIRIAGHRFEFIRADYIFVAGYGIRHATIVRTPMYPKRRRRRIDWRHRRPATNNKIHFPQEHRQRTKFCR